MKYKTTNPTVSSAASRRRLPAVLPAALLAVFLAGSFGGCAGAGPKAYGRTDVAMGTVVTQTVYAAAGPDEGQKITDDIQALLTELETETLSWRAEESELSRLNAAAGHAEGFALSERMERYLSGALEVASYSGGAFDPTVGQVTRLWNIDEWALTGAGKLPGEAEVRERLANTGYGKVRIDSRRIYMPEKMSLDLGAVGKGIACDGIVAYLKNRDVVSGAVFSVGGNIQTYGHKPDGSPWQVGVANPFRPEEYLGYLQLEGTWCVSTSGDYERYADVDGVRYHHILDPATGYPVRNGIHSVTVAAESGLLADALSTACFVAGKEAAAELAEHYGADVLIVSDGGEIWMSEGMKACFRGR